MDNPMPEMIPLSHHELGTYREIAISTFRQTFDRYNSAENMKAYVETAFDPDRLESELNPARSAVFLARWQGQTVGYIKLNFPPAFTHAVETDSVELERIYVDARWQGKRIGEALLQKAISETRKRNARFLWLGVWEKNSNALAFYEKKGFTAFGSHPFLLGDDEQTDLLLKLNFGPR